MNLILNWNMELSHGVLVHLYPKTRPKGVTISILIFNVDIIKIVKKLSANQYIINLFFINQPIHRNGQGAILSKGPRVINKDLVSQSIWVSIKLNHLR